MLHRIIYSWYSLFILDVPVSIFCTFNRIKSMTTEISTITQAMGKSKFLEVSTIGQSTIL